MWVDSACCSCNHIKPQHGGAESRSESCLEIYRQSLVLIAALWDVDNRMTIILREPFLRIWTHPVKLALELLDSLCQRLLVDLTGLPLAERLEEQQGQRR